MCDPDCVRLPHRRLGSAVPVEIDSVSIVARSSQLVLEIDQSYRGYSECKACEATVCTSGFPCAQGGEFSSPFGPLEPSALEDLPSMGPPGPALVVLTTRRSRERFFSVRTPVLTCTNSWEHFPLSALPV